ncbi:acyl-CoA dehydrogenase family protein [Ancylobacter terrae]|uniref:acyl-CoA dehydrogenase family protein n=1 Tax=Ancylobacter sp. sgz301288 TaxID=3342077 RepID=UPI003859E087
MSTPVDLGALSRDVHRLARDDTDAAIILVERHSTGDPARQRLIASALHLSVTLGVLDGFLDRATGFLRTRSTPWYGAGLARATEDPHVLRALGLLVSKRDALDALAEEALAEVAGALRHDNPPATVGRVDIARHYAARVARALVSEGIGLLGASSASGKHGFDRFWRDLAAHQLRYPPGCDAEALGRNFITETRVAS